MNFGLALPYNNTRLVGKFAQMAEDSGWDGIFLGDAIWCEDPMLALAAAAMHTRHIRLGMMIVPVPLRRPWKLASESLALDQLSEGRLVLGLGTGAVWMGWQSFPDEVTDPKTRAEMLDETIDILTLLYQRKPFDYEGKHYRLKLSLMDEMHYPPKPVQQPRIPLWAVGFWPRKKSMQRTLKCDGIIPEKLSAEGKAEDVTPEDIRAVKAYVEANRTLTTPFEIVMNGRTTELDPVERQEKLRAWKEAGVTWWIEGLWGDSEENVIEQIRRGPPRLENSNNA
ncbi:MAG: LLM class flavin-dependent oxidoreductase [Anaerolineales bacterium]|nr:LLM class flavin-dependent oxidoreductase [Anaerolineales bacterium]